MTHNQINYWNYVENKRHNIVNETIARDTLQENKRHALVTERIDQQNADTNVFNAFENQRHNKEQEAIGWGNLAETQRHNVRTEELTLETAQIHAQATVTAAGISAAATRYSADQSYAAQVNAATQNAMVNYRKQNLDFQTATWDRQNAWDIAVHRDETSQYNAWVGVFSNALPKTRFSF